MTTYDFLICGSGIAGASIAYELAPHGRVLLAEQEDSPGYHTTGRSAAMYIGSYGTAPVRILTAASRAFFDAPGEGFAQYPLLSRRGCLTIAGPSQLPALAATKASLAEARVAFTEVGAQGARSLVPVLRPEAVAGAVLEADGSDIDTNALHSGFLRQAKARGAEFRLGARIERIERVGSLWRVGLVGGDVVEARIIVNAAGAWCDQVATMAGAAPLGLTPKRRTVIIIDPPADTPIASWPTVMDVEERFYFKPESGRILASPGDETPSPAIDVAPDELDIATCVDRIQAVADIETRRVARSWAGLRTFAPDRGPVFGYDTKAAGFFWFAGQGGFGMQTSPASARLGAALALGLAVPGDLADRGLAAEAVSPARFAWN